MKAKIYNKPKRYFITKTKDKDYKLAIALCEEYIQNYPLDVFVLNIYVRLLCMYKRYDEAKLIMDRIEKLVFEDQFDTVSLNDFFYCINKMHLFIGFQRYEEAIKMYEYNKYRFSLSADGYMYSKYKLNKLSLNDICSHDSYHYHQMYDYNYEEFLNHINKHVSLENIALAEDENRDCSFYEEFPIYEVLAEIKKYIPGKCCITYDGVNDVYIFKYDKCGRCGSKSRNFFKVVTFANSDKFISIYPCSNDKNLDYIDLNYLNKITSSSVKVKRLSQIEKFNKRYQIKESDKNAD